MFIEKTLCLIIVAYLLIINAIFVTHSIDNKPSLIINIDFQYDLSTHMGSVNQSIILSGPLPEILSIPLITIPRNNSIEIVSVIDSTGVLLIYKYYAGNNSISIYLNQSNYVRIEYIIYECFEELSPGLYVDTLDLSVFKNNNYVLSRIEVKITIISLFELKLVSVEPEEGSSVSKIGNVALISINKPQIYFIIVSHSLLEETVRETGGVSLNKYFWILFLVISIGLIGFSVYYFIYRKRFVIEIETLPPNIIEDDTSKKIIEIIGDSGERGVKQSDLVSLTNRPKSSISRRVKRLSEEGYIEIVRKGKYNLLKLTNKGSEAYRSIRKKER